MEWPKCKGGRIHFRIPGVNELNKIWLKSMHAYSSSGEDFLRFGLFIVTVAIFGCGSATVDKI